MPGPILEDRYGAPSPSAPDTRPVRTLAPELLQSRAGVWITRGAACETAIVDGQLQLRFNRGDGVGRLEFITDDEARVAGGPRQGETVRFHPARELEAPNFELPQGTHWDFVAGPASPAGAVQSEYDDRLGDYEIRMWGKPAFRLTLSRDNGYICATDPAVGVTVRYSPFEQGILFRADGENLDLTGEIPTAQSIELIRTA
jgi:hypothetical protein